MSPHKWSVIQNVYGCFIECFDWCPFQYFFCNSNAMDISTRFNSIHCHKMATNLSHTTRAQLWCHVRNIVAIAHLKIWIEVSIEFECQQKARYVISIELWIHVVYSISRMLHYLLGNRMMTSSNGNGFRITGPLSGESTGHQWISPTKGQGHALWRFLWCQPK